MTHKDRRHTRYALPDGLLRSQELKRQGLMGAVSGWGDCKIKDISYAGLLLMTGKRLTIGDRITVKLTLKDSRVLSFLCNVVNASTEHSTGLLKVGVNIIEPDSESPEGAFLSTLGDLYKPVP